MHQPARIMSGCANDANIHDGDCRLHQHWTYTRPSQRIGHTGYENISWLKIGDSQTTRLLLVHPSVRAKAKFAISNIGELSQLDRTTRVLIHGFDPITIRQKPAWADDLGQGL